MGYSIKYQRLRTAERAVSDADEETLIVEPNKLSTFLKVETYSTYMIKIAAFTQRGMGPYSEYVYAGEFSIWNFNSLVYVWSILLVCLSE